MELTFMIIGFGLAAYSVVGNDVIQTLGTFLSSNKNKPWWVLWLYTGAILTAVLLYGWFSHQGDVSYGRLEKVGDLPSPFYWWYILPPLILMIITRYGIPVSTTFLVLSSFSLLNSDLVGSEDSLGEIFSAIIGDGLIGKMLTKSVLGYIVAFASAIVFYLIISKILEKNFMDKPMSEGSQRAWTVAQWASTGFLWSQWLIQDLANIYVYLPRPLDVSYLFFSLALLLGLQAFIFYNKGGEIQKVVTSKTNTTDIRSATIIDLLFGIILYFFKELSNIPMSTTWVFIGLLAGRELMITQLLKVKSMRSVVPLVAYDLLKVFIGLVVSLAVVIVLLQLK